MAWWIPLATTVVGGGINYLSQRGARKEGQRQAESSRGMLTSMLDTTKEGISGLREHAEGIETDASMEDLFGPAIQSLTDRVGADQGTAMQEVFRSMMAGGGDVTGQGAGLLNQITQTGQRSISDILSNFSEAVNRYNLQNRVRQDRLLTQATGSEANLTNMLAGLTQYDQGRVDRRSTANRQMLLDLAGLGFQGWGQLENMEPRVPKPEPETA